MSLLRVHNVFPLESFNLKFVLELPSWKNWLPTIPNNIGSIGDIYRNSHKSLKGTSILDSLLEKLGLGNNSENHLRNGIILAAPKKKPSYSRRRSRRLAPKSKQVLPRNDLEECPSCGRYKLRHRACSHCMSKIFAFWRKKEGKEAKLPINERPIELKYKAPLERPKFPSSQRINNLSEKESINSRLIWGYETALQRKEKNQVVPSYVQFKKSAPYPLNSQLKSKKNKDSSKS